MQEADQVIIGAGVIGLSIAAKLASQDKTTLILEQGPREGTGISSRNSGVIHAGIYYPENSLKAKLCVEGRKKLYQRLEQHQIPFKKIGKLMIATSAAQEQQLEKLQKQAIKNGVSPFALINHREIEKLEPACLASAALFSPETGILDAHALMTDLLGEAESKGANLITQCEALDIKRSQQGFSLQVLNQGETFSINSKQVINAAGLGANQLSRSLGLEVPPIYFGRGIYLSYAGRNPFNHLIYPTPEPDLSGLGVHGTIDMGGQLKFGPDIQWIDQESYQLPDIDLEPWVSSIRPWFPSLDPSKLNPDSVGIRPKLSPKASSFQDFVIEGSENHGLEGYVHLLGIESPGLTSCLAIADYVVNLLEAEA